MSFSHKITISNIPADKVQKCKIAGNAEVVDALVKRVVLLNRNTMELVAARNVNSDNTWEMFAPDDGDGNYILMGLDEGANFNVDAFDRVSLGTTTFLADQAEFEKVLANTEAYYIEEIVSFKYPERIIKIEGETDVYTPLEGIYFVEDIQETVITFSEGHFENSLGTVLDLSSPEYSFLKEEVSFKIAGSIYKIREVKADNTTVILEEGIGLTERALVNSYSSILDKDLEICGVGEDIIRFLPSDRAFSVFKNTSPVNLNVNFKTNVQISTGNEDIVLLGNVIKVPEDYATIQAAHDAANDGDIILIAPGTYTGRVDVSKGVHIFGTGKSPTETVVQSTTSDYRALYFLDSFTTSQSALYTCNLVFKGRHSNYGPVYINIPSTTVPYTIEFINAYLDATAYGCECVWGPIDSVPVTVNFRNCKLESHGSTFRDVKSGKINLYNTILNKDLGCSDCSTIFEETDYVTTETEGYGLYDNFNIKTHFPKYLYEQANPKYFTISKDFVNSYTENIKIGIDLSKIPQIFNEIADYTDLSVVFQDGSFFDIEVERFDKPNKKGLIWFNLPYVSDTEDTHFALLYPYSKSNIFMTETSHEHDLYSDYLFVYHMTDLPEGTDAVKDSSPNANHATPSGMTAANQGIGLLNSPEYIFTGSEIINAGNLIPVKIREGTIEAVFKTTSNKAHLLSQDSATVGDRDVNLSIGKPVGVLNDVADGYLNFEVNGNQTGETRNIVSATPVNDNQYHYAAITFYDDDFGMVLDETKANLPGTGIEFGCFGSNGLADILIGGNYLGPNFEGSIVDLRFSTKSRGLDDLVLQGKIWKENLIQDLNEPQIIPAFSFDNGSTFKTYVNNAWKAVATKDEAVHLVSGDSDWYYIDDSGTWNKAYQNNSNFALKQAMQFQENMCHVETVRNLTSAEWTSTGGMTAEGNIQIAFCYNSKIKNLCPSITDVNVDDKIILSCQSYNLEPYSTKVTGSKIEWEVRLLEGVSFDTSLIEVHSIITGGTWQPCTRNESIPGIIPGMDTTGKELQFKIIVPKDIPESVIINLIPKIY